MLLAALGFWLHSIRLPCVVLFLMGVHSSVFAPIKGQRRHDAWLASPLVAVALSGHAATRRAPDPQAIQLPSTSSAANTSHMISTQLSKWARSSSSPATSVASTA